MYNNNYKLPRTMLVSSNLIVSDLMLGVSVGVRVRVRVPPMRFVISKDSRCSVLV